MTRLLASVSRILRNRRATARDADYEWSSLDEWAAAARRDPEWEARAEPSVARDLAGEIRALLEDLEAATADEIARQIGARTQAVRHLLADEEQFRRVDPKNYGRSPRAKLYALADDEPLSTPLRVSESTDASQLSSEPFGAEDGSGRVRTDATAEAATSESAVTAPAGFDLEDWLTGRTPDPWREDRLRWLLSYPVEHEGSEGDTA